MKMLAATDQERVTRASLLLRLARALNLSRSGAIRSVRVRPQNGKVNLTLVTRPRSTVDLELWAVQKESNYFRDVFGRELSAAAE